jgi:hypothetical protein
MHSKAGDLFREVPRARATADKSYNADNSLLQNGNPVHGQAQPAGKTGQCYHDVASVCREHGVENARQLYWIVCRCGALIDLIGRVQRSVAEESVGIVSRDDAYRTVGKILPHYFGKEPPRDPSGGRSPAEFLVTNMACEGIAVVSTRRMGSRPVAIARVELLRK